MFYAGICQFTTSQQENHTGFAPPGPRLRRGAGALCLVPRLREPSASTGQNKCRALSPFGTPAALRSAFAAPRALAVSLRSSGSPHASPMASRWSPLARCGAACVVSLRPSEPCRLTRTFASLGGGLLGGRRTRRAVSPSMFSVADNHKPGYSNQGRMYHCGRAIYRAHLIIAPGMEAVMRRGGCRWFSARWRRPEEALRTGGRGQA